MVPPAQAFLQEADRRPRHDVVRPGVRPRAYQSLARTRQAGHEARDGVAVAVGPAADGVDGGLDGGEVLAHRAVLPVRVAALMAEPRLGPVGVRLEAREPVAAPLVALLAGHLRVSRQRVVVQHGGAPRQHVEARHAAAGVVHVVGVAVVGGHQRDDGLERRRTEGRHLQAVEPGPRDAGHAHGARAPGLGGDPGDRLADVLVLLRRVLVEDDAVGVPGAAQVEAHAGVAVSGPVRVDGPVTGAAVGQPVGARLEDRRHRVLLGIDRQPDPRRQAGAVAQRDPEVLDTRASRGGTHCVICAMRRLPDGPVRRRPPATGRDGGPARAAHDASYPTAWPSSSTAASSSASSRLLRGSRERGMSVV